MAWKGSVAIDRDGGRGTRVSDRDAGERDLLLSRWVWLELSIASSGSSAFNRHAVDGELWFIDGELGIFPSGS
ncbi:hypothetical protein CsSME_00025561 [Camellia sinensis var. sinensis]